MLRLFTNVGISKASSISVLVPAPWMKNWTEIDRRINFHERDLSQSEDDTNLKMTLGHLFQDYCDQEVLDREATSESLMVKVSRAGEQAERERDSPDQV
ncbi:UNVERIFIED_CONTAM: hypothetical protein K2H54_017686 [Gekko kuhli]